MDRYVDGFLIPVPNESLDATARWPTRPERMPEEGALEFSDEQARRYWGGEEYPYARDEPRVLLHVRPERVVAPDVGSPIRDEP